MEICPKPQKSSTWKNFGGSHHGLGMVTKMLNNSPEALAFLTLIYISPC